MGLVLGVLCCGCILTSSNPLYTRDLVVQLPELNGTWCTPEDQECYVVKDGQVSQRPSGADNPPTKVVFFKIDGFYFMDAEEAQGHSLYHLKWKQDQLFLIVPSFDWLEAQVNNGNADMPQIKCKRDFFGSCVSLADSEELVKFLRKYKDNPELFPAGNKGALRRKVK